MNVEYRKSGRIPNQLYDLDTNNNNTNSETKQERKFNRVGGYGV